MNYPCVQYNMKTQKEKPDDWPGFPQLRFRFFRLVCLGIGTLTRDLKPCLPHLATVF